ncbi:MAG: hypothetical protein NC307_07295 [Roseburia sp.]|nr:hypothetical protein [Roseburia sp.]
MKENMKKRLAVFLSILFVLPTIFSVLPQTAQEVQAASIYMYWNGTPAVTGGKVTVEKGAKFYVGDYVGVSTGTSVSTVSMVKASYTSSKKSVASVNSKGYVEAKATGSTKIKIKYKGKTLTCSLKVVKEGSFGTKEAYTKLAKAADTVVKNMPSKITTANGFELLKIRNDYQNVANGLTWDITEDGFVKEKQSSGYSMSTEKLVVPKAGRFNRLRQELSVYSAKNSPVSTRSSKVLKVASVSASTSKVTIKLKKAPGKDQILAMKINYSTYPEENKSAGNDKVYFYVSLINTKKANDYCSGLACMKKGSKTITVIPQKYSASKGKFVNSKLKKNTTYSLGSKTDWTKGKTFKVK